MDHRRLVCFGLLLVGIHVTYQNEDTCTQYCMQGESCWPSSQDIRDFAKTLDGKLLLPSSPEYTKTVRMKNTFETRKPAIVLVAETVGDIQKSMIFAKNNSIRVVVFSSGHDYIGRSTGIDVLMINLENMKKVNINLSSSRNPAGEITAESGNTWWRIYREVDAVDRVIIGGSAQTVSVGGYNLGGGHSPMSRKLGLAVDNLLEVQMVTVDGELITVNMDGTHSKDDSGRATTIKDDLFWALRGGGGGTFGVVVSFTMKLHYAPDGFVGYTRYFTIINSDSINLGKEVLKYYGNFMKNAPNEWSGYVIVEAKPTPGVENMQGLITVTLLHYGGWSSPSRAYLDTFDRWKEAWGPVKIWQNYTSFMDYKKNYTDPIYYRSTLMNTLVQDKNLDGFAELLTSKAYGITSYAYFGCTMVHLGGQTKVTQDPDVTSVNPALRTAAYSASCGLAWANPAIDAKVLEAARGFNTELQKYGTGVYLNEPAETENDWIRSFWGDTIRYNRLVAMKNKYDPKTFLLPKYGVGYDVCAYTLPTDAAAMCYFPLHTLLVGLFICFAVNALNM